MPSQDRFKHIINRFQQFKTSVVDIAGEVYSHTEGKELFTDLYISSSFEQDISNDYLDIEAPIQVFCVEVVYSDDTVCKIIFPKEFLFISPGERKAKIGRSTVKVIGGPGPGNR
ncbi:MAG: hypothetical protein GY754_15405 [bacterium]|nr:hypothetical protein [bacterium]